MPRKRDSEELTVDKSWLDSYADAITLLMAFFVMLFAFSLVDKKKFDDFKFGVNEAFGKPNPTIDGGLGLLDRGNGIVDALALTPNPNPEADGAEGEFKGEADAAVEGEVTRDNLDELAEALATRLEQSGVAGKVELEEDPRGLVLHLDDDVLFDSGSALVKVEGVGVLQEISDVLGRIDNTLVIEGHTDNVPTRGTVWPTNWELSVTRATRVLRWLTEVGGMPPARISAAGYAETRPRDTNTTAEGRQRNRRVEIVVVLPQTASGAGAATPTRASPATGDGGDQTDPSPAPDAGDASDQSTTGA